jgi:GH18 family chitinase
LYATNNENIYTYVIFQEYALNFYASKGFPKSKLNAGLPFYGQSFILSGSGTEVGAASDGPGVPGRFTQQNGMLAYYEICAASNYFFNYLSLTH